MSMNSAAEIQVGNNVRVTHGKLVDGKRGATGVVTHVFGSNAIVDIGDNNLQTISTKYLQVCK